MASTRIPGMNTRAMDGGLIMRVDDEEDPYYFDRDIAELEEGGEAGLDLFEQQLRGANL